MIVTILIAIVFFSLIIFVHELGHFLTARLFKVKVHEFAVGMGPKLLSWGKGETKYSIRAIPVGGFCSMEGEDSESSDEGSLSAKPWYARFIILASGAAMNILLGFVICVVFVCIYYSSGIPTTTVEGVVTQAPAAEFIQPGDRIIRVNGHRTNILKDINFEVQNNGAETMEVTLQRDGETITRKVKPYLERYEDGSTRYLVGFTAGFEKPNLFNVLRQSFYETVWNGKIVFVSLGMLISGKAGVNEVSGPVGVVNVMSEAAKPGGLAGLVNILSIAALISVNIGIMNLLPFPALDGGRILFVFIEAIRRKPIPPEKEGIVHFIGLVLLLGLMVFATWNDIMKLISG